MLPSRRRRPRSFPSWAWFVNAPSASLYTDAHVWSSAGAGGAAAAAIETGDDGGGAQDAFVGAAAAEAAEAESDRGGTRFSSPPSEAGLPQPGAFRFFAQRAPLALRSEG